MRRENWTCIILKIGDFCGRCSWSVKKYSVGNWEFQGVANCNCFNISFARRFVKPARSFTSYTFGCIQRLRQWHLKDICTKERLVGRILSKNLSQKAGIRDKSVYLEQNLKCDNKSIFLQLKSIRDTHIMKLGWNCGIVWFFNISSAEILLFITLFLRLRIGISVCLCHFHHRMISNPFSRLSVTNSTSCFVGAIPINLWYWSFYISWDYALQWYGHG